MQIGVFIPIGNNGWLISTTSPQYKPSFALNREVVLRAERYGFDFALSMIKLRGYGGPSEHWDHNLESFTLMAALAAVTSRIQLYATAPSLILPPALAARMATTIDSVAPGRFGINLITGWQQAEYGQMGMWPGESHFARRYDYLAEYTTILSELLSTGQSDFRGDFFQMDDCRLSPLPSGKIPLICAGSSDKGMRFAAQYCDYNFCGSGGAVNSPKSCAETVARLNKAATEVGRRVGALALMMIIADETDDAAMAKWEHYKAGVDVAALERRADQAGADKGAQAESTGARLASREHLPFGGTRLIGSYANVARMLDEMAEIDGLQGVMLIFDDFIAGIEAFGERIQPLMRSRAPEMLAAE